MSQVVNLRLARKQKARADKDRQAAENRAKFGQPKAETARATAVSELERRRLDALKLDDKD